MGNIQDISTIIRFLALYSFMLTTKYWLKGRTASVVSFQGHKFVEKQLDYIFEDNS